MVSGIAVAGAQTCCALLHSVCDLKATRMNVQHSLIQELTLEKDRVQKKKKKSL